MSAPRLLHVVGAISLLLTLACAGFSEGFNEGMQDEAAASMAEARAAVAACSPGPDRDALSAILDNVERGMADGTVGNITGMMGIGMVLGGAEDGCSADDVEAIRTLYPELVG